MSPKLAFTFGLLALCVFASLTAKAQPQPRFSASPVSGCAPLVVHFTDESTGNVSQWKWDLGNSTISFLQHPVATYFNAGTYTVKLVVQNAAGKDSITKLQYITVHAAPSPVFSSVSASGCAALAVPFTNSSLPGSGSIAGTTWDFGDGNSSIANQPTHLYSAPGNYHVSLQVTNSLGCSKTVTQSNYVHVEPLVNASFTHSAPTGCTAPETIQFQNTSTGTSSLSYSWNFGDGTTSTSNNPSHTYNLPGVYSVQLVTTSAAGCRDTFTVKQLNIASVRAGFNVPAITCAGAMTTFTNASFPKPDSVRWNFGDGSNSSLPDPSKLFSTAGVYKVTLTSFFGACSDAVSKDITVSAKPVTNFSGSPLTACAPPLSVNFSATTTDAVRYEWLFGDASTAAAQSPAHLYTTAGLYDVTLITTNAAGCSDTLTRAEYVQIVKPQVSINNLPQEGCAPFSVNFSATINSIDPVVSHAWDFGDGVTASTATATHVFAEGLYDIQLVTTTASGCKDTVRKVAAVRASSKPRAAFSASPREVCAFTPVNFQDESTGTVTGWLWLFGDGGTSTQQHPSHEYGDTGRFTVTLIVGNFGCYDTLVMPGYIYVNPPIARFEPIIDCDQPYVRSFQDTSPGADEWLWNFGDGAESTDQNPVHTYAAPGSYAVTLTVRNSRTGCEHRTKQTVIVADEQAAFSADVTEICRRNAVQFTGLQNNPSGISSYHWDFGDGSTDLGQATSHVYLLSGSYTVTLIITDAAGCQDTLTKPAYINVNGPTAQFNAAVPGICLAAPVSFNDNSTTDGKHAITGWSWNYGDGNAALLQAPPFSHSYAVPGSYNVSLTVTDAAGCTDSIMQSNSILVSRPVADFSTIDTSSCPGKEIRFTDLSTGNALKYAWDFGDGKTSSEATPVHTYTNDGLYAVRLRITDEFGCTDEKTRTQYIRINTPLAAFSMSDSISTCPPLVVQFKNESKNQDTYQWDFGDGSKSTESNPLHFYNTAGVYFPTLTITSIGGCTSVLSKKVVVQGPSGSFTYQDFKGCQPLTVQFKASTKGRTSFVWDFNDGTTTLTNDSIISHTYTIPGIYVPKMIIKDAAGCSVPINGRDTIVVSGVTAAFVADLQVLCSNGTVQFKNNTVSNDLIKSYAWQFGDGSTSTLAAPSHFYAGTGNYPVKLKVTTAMGCVDSVKLAVPIKVVPTPAISITQTPDGCVPVIKTFTANLGNPDTSAISWRWQLSNGVMSNLQRLQDVSLPVAGNYTASLTATNSSGCIGKTESPFSVYALPVVTAGADIFVCKGTPKLLQATGAATYAWSPSATLSCNNCATPAANPVRETSYVVTGTSAQGCINRDTVLVSVQSPFKMQYSRGDTLCMGESISLSASGAASYAWSPATGINQITGAAVKASPTTTTTYRVVGSDAMGCFKDTSFIPVKVFPIPTVEAGADVTINVGQVITLTPKISADVTEVYWTPTGNIFRSQFPSIDLKPKQTTKYQVEARNAGGCIATDNLTVHVLCNGANVFIPNTFSPNGDGVNEMFYPRGTGLFAIRTARIFNRWGEQVFESHNMKPNDAMQGWNGTFKGKPLTADVFVYVFEIMCDNNEILLYKGDVTLIR